MKSEGLTAKQVQHMKPDPAKRLEIPAGPPSGLYCVIHPTGKKSWAFRYRWHGRPTKLTLSEPYPSLSLAAARAEAEAAWAILERGGDPMAAKAEEEALEPNSAAEVANEWLERKVMSTRSGAEVERILNKDVLPGWKRKLITEIVRADVLRLLDSIVDRGAPILANRTRSILLRWFGWCLERGYIEISPVANIKPLVPEKSRDRVLTEGELLEVWNATEKLAYPFGPFVRLLILTAQRRGEVATMRWPDLDLKGAMWTLSAEQTKPGRVHDVPLSPAALDLLKSLPRFKGPFVFTTTGGTKAINGFSKAKKAIASAILKGRGRGGNKISDWTIHDLRRTAATHMAKVGVAPHVLSAILNHTPGSTQGVTSIYNRFRYTEERREALEKWADYVVSLAKTKRKLAVG